VISLQKLLGKEDQFFDLFEASAEECRKSVQALKDLLQAPGQPASMEAFVGSRRRDKAIHNDISQAVCTTVVTSLDREDIQSLANALYKIPTTVEKIGERILLAPAFVENFDFTPQVAMAERAAQTLFSTIQAMRQGEHFQAIKQRNDDLLRIEGYADKLVLKLLGDLYASEMTGRRVVFLKDLFELFEKVTDRCRDAGNVILQIVLKNS
jgi:uncharacterized protein Yka (UPF0111/DUF47 family)